MSKPKIWDTLKSFSIYPKLTFFGLDKSKAHCFTLHKEATEQYKQYFGLNVGTLQKNIIFLINNQTFPAMVRLVRMNRSKTYKLTEKELSKREIIQFDWKKNPLTQMSIKNILFHAFSDLTKTGKNTNHKISFHHLKKNIFFLSTTIFEKEYEDNLFEDENGKWIGIGRPGKKTQERMSLSFPRPLMGNRIGLLLVKVLFQMGLKVSIIYHITKDVFPRSEITKDEIKNLRDKLVKKGKLDKKVECLISKENALKLSMELQTTAPGQNWSLMEVILITEYYFEILSTNEDLGKIETTLSDVVHNLPKRTIRSIKFKLRNISAILNERNNYPFIKQYEPLGNYQKLLKEVVQSKFYPSDPNRKSTLIQDYISSKNQISSSFNKNKYYAVVQGHKPGIYQNWNKAKSQIENYSKNHYKSFDTKSEALIFFHDQIEKLIKEEMHKDATLKISDLSKKLNIQTSIINKINNTKNLNISKGYSKEYNKKLKEWAQKREKIRQYLTNNPGASTKEVSTVLGVNSATVIDESRKSNLKLTLNKVSVIQKTQIEAKKDKENKIRDYLFKNLKSDARLVSQKTGTSLARIYTLARKESLQLGKALTSNKIGQKNRNKIEKLYRSNTSLTARELAHQTGLSITTISQHLRALGIKRETNSKTRKRRMSQKYEKLKVL